jgi:hypothetical protein
MYKLQKYENQIVGLQKQDGNVITSIPMDEANTDAQQFAKWLQEGNLPEAAEEGGTVTQEWATETIAKLLPNG